MPGQLSRRSGIKKSGTLFTILKGQQSASEFATIFLVSIPRQTTIPNNRKFLFSKPRPSHNISALGKQSPNAMSDQIQEFVEVPLEFAKDGLQLMRRCQKRQYRPLVPIASSVAAETLQLDANLVDSRPEGVPQAMPGRRHRVLDHGDGWLLCVRPTSRPGSSPFPGVLQLTSFCSKIIHIPVNNILVGGA
jgi:hypothetical protein